MQTRNIVGTLLLALTQVAPAQGPDLRATLEATKASFSDFRMRASVKHLSAPNGTPGPSHLQSGVWTWQWACAGEMRYQLGPTGGGNSWDGKFMRNREANKNGPAHGSISPGAPILEDDPVNAGYRVSIPIPGNQHTQELVWIGDLLNEPGASASRQSNGKIQVNYSAKLDHRTRTFKFVVDPARGNMIESQVETTAERNNILDPNTVAITVATIHVISARQVDGHWIPVDVKKHADISVNTRIIQSADSEFQVTDISKDAPDTLFTGLLKPGDIVLGDGGPFNVAENGELTSTADKPLSPAQSLLRAIALALGVTAVLVLLGRTLRSRRDVSAPS